MGSKTDCTSKILFKWKLSMNTWYFKIIAVYFAVFIVTFYMYECLRMYKRQSGMYEAWWGTELSPLPNVHGHHAKATHDQWQLPSQMCWTVIITFCWPLDQVWSTCRYPYTQSPSLPKAHHFLLVLDWKRKKAIVAFVIVMFTAFNIPIYTH